MNRTLVVPRVALTAMQRHIRRRAPLEACGLLAGRNERVELVVGVRNTARSTLRYQMDPRQQWRAFEKFEQLGLELLGIYHSHPNGPSRPSPTDIREALYEAVQVIWWRNEETWLVDGFWIAAGKVSKVTLQIER